MLMNILNRQGTIVNATSQILIDLKQQIIQRKCIAQRYKDDLPTVDVGNVSVNDDDSHEHYQNEIFSNVVP